MNRDFHTDYGALEQLWTAHAEADLRVYLPNPEPLAPAPYILICQEPSLGGWARGLSLEQARAKVESGFRNFLAGSLEINILHFCARRYLCGPSDRYHITDLSKGAMRTDEAKNDWRQRYDRWFPSFLDEIDLCATADAQFVAVGRQVADNFPKPFTHVIHYSPQACGARKAAVADHQVSFERFKPTVSIEDILATTEETFRQANLRPDLATEWLSQLAKRQLTDSHRQLIFHYKTQFELMRTAPSIAVAA